MNFYKLIFTVAVLFAFLFSEAQEKKSYAITKAGQPVECSICESALGKIIIDKYRYSDERRMIKLVDEKGNYLYDLTLFSGEELRKIGKPLSPLNKLHSEGSDVCEMILFSSGDLKPKLCK